MPSSFTSRLDPHFGNVSLCEHGKPVFAFCLGCETEKANAEKDRAESALFDTSVPEKADTEDRVNWPSHYNQGEIECIDAMLSAYGREAVENYCTVAAFKYLWRFNRKNGGEDLKKAIWYLRFATGDDPRKEGR